MLVSLPFLRVLLITLGRGCGLVLCCMKLWRFFGLRYLGLRWGQQCLSFRQFATLGPRGRPCQKVINPILSSLTPIRGFIPTYSLPTKSPETSSTVAHLKVFQVHPTFFQSKWLGYGVCEECWLALQIAHTRCNRYRPDSVGPKVGLVYRLRGWGWCRECRFWVWGGRLQKRCPSKQAAASWEGTELEDLYSFHFRVSYLNPRP